MVRRRRDEADARRRVAHLGDHRVDLVAGQLAAFAGLRALRHLDLDHVGVDEVLRRHAEATRRHLLDGGTLGIPIGQRLEAIRLLTAFARVRLAADPVHGDSERGVRLARDRAERHGAGGETAHDGRRGLDFFERHRRAPVLVRGADAEQTAQREVALLLLVQHLRVGAILVLRVAAHGVLEQRHGLGRPRMSLAANAEGVFAADGQRGAVHRRVAERIAMALRRLHGDL